MKDIIRISFRITGYLTEFICIDMSRKEKNMSMCVITRDRTKEKKGVAGEEPQMGHPERGTHGREHHLGK